VNDECVKKYQELKLGHQHRYVLFKLTDDLKEVHFEKVGKSDNYDDFERELKNDECRYAVYDFAYTADDGGPRNKILFILWCPDAAKVKSKMIYTSSKDSLRKALVGIGTEVQATDRAEISREAVLEKCLRK